MKSEIIEIEDSSSTSEEDFSPELENSSTSTSKKRKFEEENSEDLTDDANNTLNLAFKTIEVLAKSSESVTSYSMALLNRYDYLTEKNSSLLKENQELKTKIQMLFSRCHFLKTQNTELKDENQKLHNLICNPTISAQCPPHLPTTLIPLAPNDNANILKNADAYSEMQIFLQYYNSGGYPLQNHPIYSPLQLNVDKEEINIETEDSKLNASK